MSTRLFLALACALIIVRLPSLVQPMGPDQGLYAYVGERILHGELPYRDAWDQKPPGIHYVYAGLRAAYPRDAAIPADDLLAAIGVAAARWALGARLAGPVAGGLSAVLFLFLSDPSFARYGGVRVRAQCETFIALAASVAVLLALTRFRGAPRRVVLFASGLLVGVAFALKYNAGIYGLVALVAVALTTGLTLGDVIVIVLGAAVVPLILLGVFLNGGAVRDLYQATVAYNLQYSGETYASRLDTLRYLARFPIQHARVDALWTVGGAGCIVLLVAGIKRRPLWLPVAWVAAACIAIAVNGSRGLPQYFVQAAPALALAAGVGAAVAFPPLPRLVRWIVVILVAVGVWRVDEFPKLASNVWHDTKYIAGRIDRRDHLARYGGLRESDKYSALDNLDLGATLDAHSRPGDTVYVFGFSPGAYVYASRRSASRFFWSRPVIVGFNDRDPRYGVSGLLSELQMRQPAVIALQRHDWYPDVQDSAAFFMSQPALAGWLRANYREFASVDAFSTWERISR